MRRKGKVGRVGDKYLNILLQNGGTMTLKRTDFPSLVEDAEVVITLAVARKKKQAWPSAKDVGQRRRIRWGLRTPTFGLSYGADIFNWSRTKTSSLRQGPKPVGRRRRERSESGSVAPLARA